MHKKSKRAQACDISKAVKLAVYERDEGLCILCGRPGISNAHFVRRSQGGLGIEENIFTACPDCHRAYDESGARRVLEKQIESYLRIRYPDWSKEDLYYKKGVGG